MLGELKVFKSMPKSVKEYNNASYEFMSKTQCNFWLSRNIHNYLVQRYFVILSIENVNYGRILTVLRGGEAK